MKFKMVILGISILILQACDNPKPMTPKEVDVYLGFNSQEAVVLNSNCGAIFCRTSVKIISGNYSGKTCSMMSNLGNRGDTVSIVVGQDDVGLNCRGN